MTRLVHIARFASGDPLVLPADIWTPMGAVAMARRDGRKIAGFTFWTTEETP